MAQCNLGICYEQGTGVEKDLELAAYWYTQSANQGYKRAKQRLYSLQTGSPTGSKWGDIMLAVAQGLNQMASTYSQGANNYGNNYGGGYGNAGNAYTGGNNYSAGNNSSNDDKSKKTSLKTQYMNSGAYKRATMAYSKWESTVMDMKINPERYSHLSREQFRKDVQKAQNEMKRIRAELNQYGFQWRVSEYENWRP